MPKLAVPVFQWTTYARIISLTIVGTPTDFGNIRNEFYAQNYPREVLFSIKFVNLAKCQISGMFVSRPHISATESRRELAFAPFDAK